LGHTIPRSHPDTGTIAAKATNKWTVLATQDKAMEATKRLDWSQQPAHLLKMLPATRWVLPEPTHTLALASSACTSHVVGGEDVWKMGQEPVISPSFGPPLEILGSGGNPCSRPYNQGSGLAIACSVLSHHDPPHHGADASDSAGTTIGGGGGWVALCETCVDERLWGQKPARGWVFYAEGHGLCPSTALGVIGRRL